CYPCALSQQNSLKLPLRKCHRLPLSRKITINPRIQTSNTKKTQPPTHSCGIAGQPYLGLKYVGVMVK
ncbi:MAG: hypothetical protein J7M40_16245, partial [Planctomycetes bacterium]|nr:hypothetical protein [Planctomycetota bacterium]